MRMHQRSGNEALNCLPQDFVSDTEEKGGPRKGCREFSRGAVSQSEGDNLKEKLVSIKKGKHKSCQQVGRVQTLEVLDEQRWRRTGHLRDMKSITSRVMVTGSWRTWKERSQDLVQRWEVQRCSKS